jgi:ubiquinone/menaquinone biosynthesis C-methylase UbiE
MNEEDYLATGFQNVDDANTQKITRYLDGVQALPFLKKYKNRTLELLCDGGNLLGAVDIGCGLGDDVVKLKRYFRRAVGVDASSVLIKEAVRRHKMTNCEFYCADAAELPFVDAEFDCARIDRALQHIADPDKVVREMLRIVRPGGKILCAEPDWGTFFIGTSMSNTTKAIQNHYASVCQNPWVGRNLPSIMKMAGVKNVVMEGHLLLTEGFEASNLVFDISTVADQIGHQQGISNEIAKWLDNYRNGDAIAGGMLVLCYGTK